LSYEMLTDSFSEIKIRVSNRSTEPIFPLLRIQPSIRNQPHNISLDLSKKFVWNGTLQQTLSLLGPKESTEATIGITPLCRGEFEISASVEEAKLMTEKDDESLQEASPGRPRANTRQLMDALLGVRERNIWHSRQPYLLTVKDDVSDDDDDQ